MSSYAAPLTEIRFALAQLGGMMEIAALPGLEEATPDLVDAVLDEAARLAAEVLAPLSQVGDRQGCRLADGAVWTPDGWSAAYRRFAEGGWNGLPFDPAYGGQGLPWLLAAAVQEIWHGANAAFALCPLLNQGAIDAITHHGSAEQKAIYLPPLIAGRWTGTMNLTEPQAGSDVGAVRTRAASEPDGSYRITGQKMFITYAEHDMAENIVHLVLARTPGAPSGVKGVSLFIVPKFIPRPDGSLGNRNDVRVVSLEHKMGIKGSPTGSVAFGDAGGAVGWLVGQENKGLAHMFTMMNNARLGVGLQGVAVAERAYQQARDYARQRIQSRALGSRDPEPVAIIRHPDVRRMLMTMRAATEAARGLAYFTAGLLDLARRHPELSVRDARQALVDLLIPVVKGWCTEQASVVASLGIQVHGGMGYIEETGAAQHLRDVRIAEIYEGTTGIQANDLIGRKLMRDGGQCALHFIGEMGEAAAHLGGGPLARMRANLEVALDKLQSATRWMLLRQDGDPNQWAAGAVPYLRLWGTVVGGWVMARSALAAEAALRGGDSGQRHLAAKLITARFYCEHILPQAPGLAAAAMAGAEAVMALPDEDF